MLDSYLTIKECAERRGITRAAVHAAIKRGAIKSERKGSMHLIREADCMAYSPSGSEARAALGRRTMEKRWGKNEGEPD